MNHRRWPEYGFSFLESLIGITIILILVGVAIAPFQRLRHEQLLKGAVEDALALLNNARTQTLAGKESSQYGVHFENDTMILFRGSAYPGITETTISLQPQVTFGPIQLAGGGADVVFQRLTGATAHTGSVTIELVDDASERRVIEIHSTGLIDATL